MGEKRGQNQRQLYRSDDEDEDDVFEESGSDYTGENKKKFGNKKLTKNADKLKIYTNEESDSDAFSSRKSD